MPSNGSDKPERDRDRDSLLSMKNVGLVVLPWLQYQQDVLKEARKVVDDEKHPLWYWFYRLGNVAAGTQVGVRKILRDRPQGDFFIQLGAPILDSQKRLIDAVEAKNKKIAKSAAEYVDLYEAILDAAVKEVSKKTGNNSGQTGE